VTTQSDEIQNLINQARKLKASFQESLPNVIANSVASIVVDLSSGVIVYGTPLADEMFGYIERELEGKHLNVLIPERFHNQHNDHFALFAMNPKRRAMGTMAMKLYGISRDGTEFPVAVSLYPRAYDGNRYCIATILKLPV
jgi:PAS domain S-box-containing protein